METGQMKLTAEMVKEAARKAGCGDVGIGNIERFEGAPRQMHPRNIYPECKSIITIIQPIPRGSYRGITEGTNWDSYMYYSYSRLNSTVRPRVTYDTAAFIEDHGFEAVPILPGTPSIGGAGVKGSPDRPAAEINLQVRIVAAGCGMGEIGWSKNLIHPKFGPRVRIGTILTDAELEPDPIIEPGTLCKRCMKCAKLCPGNAIPLPGERESKKVRIEDKVFEWGDLHGGRCTLTHHGLSYEVSPFLKKYYPGLNLDAKTSNVTQEEAYRLAWILALGKFRKSLEYPTEDSIPYYRNSVDQCLYYGTCGARGCIRACVEHLEKTKRIEQNDFETPVFPDKVWNIKPTKPEDCGGVAEGKLYPELFMEPDPNPANWK
jgi:ferredoxin